MPKSRKKKNEHKDFQKVKLKVGKKLKKADNVTNASFQTRTIQVTQKIKTATGNEPSSKRKLNVNDLLNQFQHYSTTTRHDAVMGLRELFTSYPEIIVPNLVTVIERTTHLFVDKDAVVRQSVVKLLKVIFSSVSDKQVSPFLHVISAHLCCAMTHIYDDIQADSLQILDLLLQHFPKLVVNSSSQILPNFIEQISRSRLDTKRGSSALSVNPNLKMATHKWRAKVLTRLHKLLSAIIGENTKLDDGSQTIKPSVAEKTWEKTNMIYVQPLPQAFAFKWTQPRFILRSKVNSATRKDSTVSLSDITGVRKFVKLIVPLLIECWVESNTVTTYNNKGTDNMIAVDSLPLRTNVVSVIQLLCQYIVQNYPSEVVWLNEMYVADFENHLLKAFPYSVHIPAKKQDKGDSQSIQESVCNLNIAICDIMTHFTTAPSSGNMDDNLWETTVIQYLQDTVQHESLDKHQLQIIVDILRRLIELDNGLNLDSMLEVMLQKYKKSHPLSTEKRLMFYFFSGIILDKNKQCKLGADSIDTFITSLPDLFITVVKGNQQMAAQVLQVMKTAACQNCWILLQQLDKFICKTIENKDNILLNLDDQSKKSLLELVFYVPHLQETSLKIDIKLIRNVDFPIQSCLYLLQIIHHRFSLEAKTIETTAKYISFMLSILIGNEEDKIVGSHQYEVSKEADHKFLTGSMKWERTLIICKAVCLHMNQYGDTTQLIQVLSTYLNKFKSTTIELTEQQLISLMILTNNMEFYKYPITDGFTNSLVPYFWTFCKKVTVTETHLLCVSVEKFKLLVSVVMETLMDSLCQSKNGLSLLISVNKEDLHESKSTLPELKVVCQSALLWIRHYDTWIQRSSSPIERTGEIGNNIDIIQDSCPELKQQQWWSDFSFMVSRLKL